MLLILFLGLLIFFIAPLANFVLSGMADVAVEKDKQRRKRKTPAGSADEG